MVLMEGRRMDEGSLKIGWGGFGTGRVGLMIGETGKSWN